MDLTTLLILIGVVAVIIIFILVLLSKQYRKVGPNEVLIISGGRKRTVVDPDGTRRKIGYRMHIGGGTLVLPFLETARVLPLEVYTLDLLSNEAITAKGIQVNAVGQAQIKIGGDEASIRLAAEQFLGKGEEGIRDVATKILEGHMRAALGTMSVEELFQKRGEFSSLVKQSATKDFDRMGLDMLSFSLKDLSDTSGYIEALGKPRIAEAKSEATVAEANAEKEATIKAAEARKEADIAKFKAETEIASANREYELKRTEYQAAVNEKKASADLTYELERQKMNQKLKKEEYQVRLIEKEEAIKLEEKEIQRKEKELESTVKKQADARKYQVMAETEAEQYRLGAQAKAKAEAIKLEGEAEADIMKKKAVSYSEYNQAAVYEMLIKIMPELARAVSEPLSKVDKIVMVDSGGGGGASKLTKQVADVLAQLPAVVESLSGVDLKKLIEKIPQSDKGSKKSGEKS
ncbi:MAG: flotillin [Candidatus Zixiibacteriota bacterium]|nr:MAG: flotillin [candidate division Zixibacteria bacterium]